MYSRLCNSCCCCFCETIPFVANSECFICHLVFWTFCCCWMSELFSDIQQSDLHSDSCMYSDSQCNANCLIIEALFIYVFCNKANIRDIHTLTVLDKAVHVGFSGTIFIIWYNLNNLILIISKLSLPHQKEYLQVGCSLDLNLMKADHPLFEMWSVLYLRVQQRSSLDRTPGRYYISSRLVI